MERAHRCNKRERIVTYEFADKKDLPAIQNLLQTCHLPANDLEAHLTHFVLAKEAEQVVGCIGMELQGPLLRSLAVDPEFRNQGIAGELSERLLVHAKEMGCKEIFLLTDTAAKFFAKAGFQKIEREQAPDKIRSHKQFTDLCPSSAVVMRKELL